MDTRENICFSLCGYAFSPAKQIQPVQCDSAFSWAESFEKTFERNSRENVHKLQKLEYAQVNQMIQKAIDHVCQLDESGYLNELDQFCELVELDKLDELDVLGKLDELVELGELGKSLKY